MMRRTEVDFSKILRDWDGFGVNYVEVAQTRDYQVDPQEYGGFSILTEAQRQEIIDLIFGEDGLKPGLVKMFLDPFHQKAPGAAVRPRDHDALDARHSYERGCGSPVLAAPTWPSSRPSTALRPGRPGRSSSGAETWTLPTRSTSASTSLPGPGTCWRSRAFPCGSSASTTRERTGCAGPWTAARPTGQATTTICIGPRSRSSSS